VLTHSGIFELLSEIAIAVAGFAGVAVALGGRDRTFGPMELVRITSLFYYSGLVLAGSFGLFALTAAEVGSATAIRLVSFGEAIGFVAFTATTGPSAIRNTRPNESWVPFAVIGTYAVIVLLCLVNGLVVVREWPLIVAFSITILLSLWLFFRLLTRRS
jgi:hypothetical protein